MWTMACDAKLGEIGSRRKNTNPYVQDFYKIRDECLAQGTKWEDPDFVACFSSFTFKAQTDSVEWKRPGEIVEHPMFFDEGASSFDVGLYDNIGDCWLAAAVANLTMLPPRLFHQVVPDDQAFTDKYAGIFHFRFWQYGQWVDVVVDDRLPTQQTKQCDRLIYRISRERNEFWSALLEKAYAKLFGSYEDLNFHGRSSDAMVDFTGGVTEVYNLNEEAPAKLFHILLKAYERNSLMGCSTQDVFELHSSLKFGRQTAEGLVRRHWYNITRVQYVDINTPKMLCKIPLVRIRNLWGNKTEWNPSLNFTWSPEWMSIPESEKKKLVFKYDGEYWMCLRDFITHFDYLEICNLSPDSLTEEELTQKDKKKWEMSLFEGEWVRGVTAGGCNDNPDAFCRNPQYRITLTDVDDEDDENKCTLIVGLMQKTRRTNRRIRNYLHIGFYIYDLGDPNNLPIPLDINFFKRYKPEFSSSRFINRREFSARVTLPPGDYCIVPSTYDPNEEGEFLVRVFSEKKNSMEENDIEVGITYIDDRVFVLSQPPPEVKEADYQVRDFFLKLAGQDMEVDWNELKEILDYALRNDTVGKGGFSKDICRSMIAMLDADHSGKLDFEEFNQLWSDIRRWEAIYQMYSKETQGYLTTFELREALKSAGYKLNKHILNILARRYASKDRRISFDDFIMCAVKLRTMIQYFKDKDPTDSNKAMFTLGEWVQKTLYS